MRTLALLSLLVLAACEEEPASGPVVVQKTRAAVTDAGAGEAEAAAPYVYQYNSQNKRDPFRGSDVRRAASENPEAEACTEALCQFDIEELRLVAVVSGDANPMAMVEDRSGFGHVMRRNSKVGRGGGKVTAIDRNCVEITSYRAGPDGRMMPEKQKLCVDVGISQSVLEQVTQPL